MFYTSPDAEVHAPRFSANKAERLWRWIELGLQIPYFLLSVRISNQDTEMVRRLVLGQLRDVLDIASRQTESFKILDMKLLSPSYMNGSEGYQLGTIKEIWGARGTGQPNIFVMTDNSKLTFSLGSQGAEDVEMELLLAL